MAAHWANTHGPKSSGQALMGFAIAVLCGSALRGAVTLLRHFLCSLTAQLLQALACLFMAVCRLLEIHVPDFERLIDCYWMAAALFPLVHCVLGMRSFFEFFRQLS